MKKKTRLLILFGGRSSEHEVSLRSTAAICQNLRPERYQTSLVYIDRRGRWFRQKAGAAAFKNKALNPRPDPRGAVSLPLGKRGDAALGSIDVVFPILHGPYGEDGTLQGLLELLGLPYVGCGVLASAACMDKEATKRLAEQAGLPVLPYIVAGAGTKVSAGKVEKKLGWPVFVKPARQGSSVGVSRVAAPRGLKDACRHAFRFDDKILIEKGLTARELECAVLGGGSKAKASCLGEIIPSREFYTYAAKYLDPEGARLVYPVDLGEKKTAEARGLALAAFKALDCHGMARVDMLQDKKTGRLYLNELNTIPGFTAISMYPKLWEVSGVSFPKLLDRLIDLALLRHRQKSKLKTSL